MPRTEIKVDFFSLRSGDFGLGLGLENTAPNKLTVSRDSVFFVSSSSFMSQGVCP